MGVIMRVNLLFAGVASLAICAAVPVAAQELPAAEQSGPNSPLGDEIVVTAQKRSQDVQDVGIAIAAFSGEQLRVRGIADSTNLAAITPGVHISGNLAGQNTQLTIRGVTQNDFNDIVEAPNAAYLDEAYIAVAQAQTFAVFDIDRVELLKGPQGTLFGRNATGGLVHYISRKPGFDRAEGYFDSTVSLFDAPGTPAQYRLEGALGGPLAETVAARAAFVWNKRDPLLRNLYPQGAVGGSPGQGAGANLGDDDTLAGRFTLAWRPNATTNVSLAFNGARSRVSTGPYQQKPTIAVFDAQGELVNVVNAAPNETRASIGANGQDVGSDLNNDGVFGDSFGRPVAGGDFFGYKDRDGAGFTTSSDFAFRNSGHVDSYGVGLHADTELASGLTLTSITDYKHFNKLLFIDVDAGPGNQAANYAGLNGKQFSQELRLNGKADGLDWVVGAYYLHIDNASRNGLKFPVGSVVPGAPFDLASDARLKTNSYSAFGQIDWKFAPKLGFILGGRVIREEKDYTFTQALYFTQDSRAVEQGTPVIIGPTPTGAYARKTGNTLWAGKAQLEFRPGSDLLVFAGVNRGVKAGSFNAQLSGGLAVPTSAIAYRPEVLTSYEGGFKYTFPDGRTRFNSSAFYYDYKDYQSFLFTGVSGVVINANARTYGIEADFYTSPLRGLDISLAGSWFNAKVKNVPLRVGGPIVRDVKPTYSPERQVSGLVRYQWDALGGQLALFGEAQYASSFFYNLRNFDADKYPGYVVLNAGLSWRSLDRHWELGLDVRNLSDKRVGVQGFDLATFCGCNEVSYKPPRSVVFHARRSF